ncbi:MAG TPA: translocation/assembly module TamB domain-containing protein [Patescibacteria group bacterium]|nr:translocation/assembly module TamB domain-containing protein [Patescibacteria group bacterium]
MKVRWRKIGKWVAAALVLIAALAATTVVLWKTGRITRWARVELVRQVEKATGGKVDLGGFHLSLFPFRVELDRFTLHGRETAGQPPFLHIDRVTVGVDWRALLERKVILGNVTLERPQIDIRIDKSGHSNVPVPARRGPSRPWPQPLFAVTIDHLRIEDALICLNDRKIPLTAGGGRFTFRMDYSSAGPGRDLYRGQIGWREMRIAAQRWVPFRSNWSAQFTIGRRGGSLDQFRWELPHSSIEAHADWPAWTQPRAELHFRVRLNLGDVRTLLRKPHTPTGIIESTGDLRYAPGAWSLRGYYSAQDISIGYKWYHASGMRSRGTLVADPRRVEIPDFQAWAMGGEFTGRVHMDMRTLDFTAITDSHKVSLAQLLAAVQNSDFPVQTLHWESNVQINSVTTWRADFRDMASRGTMQWTPPAQTPAGEIPASASIEYNYHMARNTVFAQGDISTPHTRLKLAGTIGERDSDMKTDLAADRLLDWDDLINHLRGTHLQPVSVSGRATWQGSVTGPVSHPLFSGQVHAWQASYGSLHWKEIEGGADYSPDGLTLTDMRVRRGRSLATISLHLDFTNWAFLPQNAWSFTAHLAGADTDDLQGLAGTRYPVRGLLSGEFRGGGTRQASEFSGNFHFVDFQAGGFRFATASGRLQINPDLVRVAGVNATFGPGTLGGDLTYQRSSGNVEFDLFGRALPLDKLDPFQSPSLPLAGSVDFRLTGSGPPWAPQGNGRVKVTGFRAGEELIGDLSAQANSNGKQLRVTLATSLAHGTMSGGVDLTLADDYPIEGRLTARGIDLNPFIKAGLHLAALTSRSQVDGHFRLTGQLLKPDTLAVEADVSRLELAYEDVKLENVGPLRLVYRKAEVSVEQAVLTGIDSNFRLNGVVRFNRNQPLDLRVAGSLNLKLLAGFVPAIRSQGAAQVDAVILGTFGQPRINGRARLENAALNYSDIPIGLSAVNGDLLFSRDHVSFSNLKAQAGGGSLLLDGSVNFAPGAARVQYNIHIAASQVRVRWPEGLSWLLDADARMVGNTKGADLGGRITLRRLFLTNGPDIAGLFMMAPHQANVETGSPFLQNLRLDFNVTSGAGAQLSWTGARIETDANVRVRGTWNRPSVLGHVHLLSGRVSFRGNTYRLSRGDMNFANPLVLDPVMNVEATTTIQQYGITVDLTGPVSSMRLSYRSDPPLPESDVISLLALGYTGEASELRTASQTSQFNATALLSEAVSSEVGGRIARLFGISRFQIEPYQAATATGSTAAARIAIEQQVTPNLTVTYATNASSNAEQVIQIEYAVTRNISVVALRDINGTFGIDVEFKHRFK